MKNFDWNEFKKCDVAIHCNTEEKAIDFLRECKTNGMEWVDGDSIEPSENYFYNNEDDTHYIYENNNGIYYSSFDSIKEGYKIIDWEIDEIKEEKKIYKIQDLLKDHIGKSVNIANSEFDEFYTVSGETLIDCNGVGIEENYNLGYIVQLEFELVEEEKKLYKTKGYLANGLFGLGDRLVNELLAKRIRESVDVNLYVPQENMAINDKQAYADSKQIYEGDYTYLKETDFLVAVIDGCEIDSGTSAEIGIVSTMGKKIYALYTDTRQQGTENQRKIEALVNDSTENQFMYRNLFVVGLIKKHGYIFGNIEDLVKQLKADIEEMTYER